MNRTKKIKVKRIIKGHGYHEKRRCKFECDESIHEGIKWLNKHGYYTLACCSGMKEDHEGRDQDELYVIFDVLRSNMVCLIEDIANEMGFETKIRDDKDIIEIRTTSDNRLEMFETFVKKLKSAF